MIWADGRRYDGEWLENRCNGRGVLTYRDGRRYEGEYKLGLKHGRLHSFEGTRKVPLANLFVSMLNAVDVPVKSFADSTGRMAEAQV